MSELATPASTQRSNKQRNARLNQFKCGVAAITLMIPIAAAAQSLELREITVTGEQTAESPTGPVDGYVAKRTVTGSKTDTPLLEIPQSISVVTRDQMAAQAVENISQALLYSAGVVGEPYGTDARFDSPIIRGFSAANSQYLNGLKLERSGGMVSMEPYGFERINVLRGPASVLYGQGNPGGLIDFISKRPLWKNYREINLEAGTFDRYTGSFDLSGVIPNTTDFAYRLTGLARQGNTQVDHVKDDRYFIAPAFSWRPSTDTTFTLLTNFQHDLSGSPVGLPNEYTVNRSSDNRLSRSTYLGDPNFDSSDRTLSNVGYELKHRFNETWSVEQNARYTWLNWYYQNLYYSGLSTTDPSIANRGASYQTENLGTFTIDNHAQAKFGTGPLSHTVLVGLDIRRHHTDTLTEFGTAPSINIYNLQYGQTIARNVWYTSKVDGTLLQTGLYAQDQIKFGKWVATLGLRHDWASTESSTLTNFGDTYQDQSDRAFTYRAGLTYLFDNGVAPYASYSTSFEPVIGNMPASLGGAAFKPSEGEQYELGVKYQPAGWRGFITAAVYDLTQTNVTSTALVNGVNATAQEGEVKVRGVEISALASLAEGLDLTANYTYTDAKLSAGDNAGNRPANVPLHAANAWLDYTFKSGRWTGLGFGGGTRYVGSRYDLNTNANKLDANLLFDAAAHYEIGAFKFQINVRNILDVNYVASCGSFGCYFGDGRTVTGKVTYKF